MPRAIRGPPQSDPGVVPEQFGSIQHTLDLDCETRTMSCMLVQDAMNNWSCSHTWQSEKEETTYVEVTVN